MERLGSLQITEEASNKYEQTDTEILETPAQAMSNENVQTVTPKSMVSDLRWFDGD